MNQRGSETGGMKEINVLEEKNLGDFVSYLLENEEIEKNRSVYFLIAEDDAPNSSILKLQNASMFQVHRAENVKVCFYNTIEEVLELMNEISVNGGVHTVAFYDLFLSNHLTPTHNLLLYLVYRLTRNELIRSFINIKQNPPSMLSKWLQLLIVS